MAAQPDTQIPSTVSSQNEKPNNIQPVNFHGNGEYKLGAEQHPKLVSDDSLLSVKERDAVNVSQMSRSYTCQISPREKLKPTHTNKKIQNLLVLLLFVAFLTLQVSTKPRCPYVRPFCSFCHSSSPSIQNSRAKTNPGSLT